MATAIILGVCGSLILLCLVLMARNAFVYRYRTRLIRCIGAANESEIAVGMSYTGWRFQWFDSVSYNRMVIQFWRPLSSFYPNRARVLMVGADERAVNA